MGKFTSYEKKMPTKSDKPHPIWNGIGCLGILIVPVMSYALSTLTVEYAVNNGIQIPPELTGYLSMPGFILNVPGLGALAAAIQGQYYLYAYLLLTVFFIVLIAGLLTLTYAFMYRASGRSRYSDLDAPMPSRRTKKYKR